MIGETIGQYKITEELGKGGFAIVYKAYQASLKRYVAIKILHSQFADDEKAVTRFQREAMAAANLRHPNIITIYDVGQQGSLIYIVMEYVEGDTLKKLLGRPVDVGTTYRIISVVASALHHAHQNGIVHRDIKPTNILIDPQQRIILSDFGIAQITGVSVSLTGGVIGTPQYMSPEQAMGKRVDGRSDLYSLGVLLFEMLTGKVPFKADTPVATLSMHINAPVPPPRALNAALSPQIEQVVLKALAKDPGLRYQTGEELAQALAQASGRGEARAPQARPTALRGPVTRTLSGDLDPRRQARLERLYAMGKARMEAGEWRWAVDILGEVLEVDAEYKDARELRRRAETEYRRELETQEHQRQLSQLHVESERALAGENWDRAVELLQKLVELDPTYGEAKSELETARRMQSLARLKAEAADLVSKGQWAEAISKLEEIKALDPNYVFAFP